MKAAIRMLALLLCAVLALTFFAFAGGIDQEEGELPPTPLSGGGVSGVYGDVNGDGEVTGKDVTLLRRHLAGGYGVTINETLADCSADGAVTGKDVTLMRRYLAGGYAENGRTGTPYTP